MLCAVVHRVLAVNASIGCQSASLTHVIQAGRVVVER